MRIFRLGVFSLGNAQVANNDDKEEDTMRTSSQKNAINHRNDSATCSEANRKTKMNKLKLFALASLHLEGTK